MKGPDRRGRRPGQPGWEPEVDIDSGGYDKNPAEPNFVGCDNVGQLLTELQRAYAAGGVIESSNGQVFSLQDLAIMISAALEEVRRRSRDGKKIIMPDGSPVSFKIRTLPAREMDDVLSSFGVTSASGLRAAVARVLNHSVESSEYLSASSAIDRVLEQGAFHPLLTMDEASFTTQYSEDWYEGHRRQVPREPETDAIARSRWDSMREEARKAASRAEYEAKQAEERQWMEWKSSREGMVFPVEALAVSDIVNQRVFDRQRREILRRRSESPQNLGFVRFAFDFGFGGRVAKSLTEAGGGKDAVRLIDNRTFTGDKSKINRRFTRSLVIPISEQGDQMVISIHTPCEISGGQIGYVEQPAELPQVCVEWVGDVCLLDNQRLNSVEKQALISKARLILSKVEADALRDSGINLNLVAKLEASLV